LAGVQEDQVIEGEPDGDDAAWETWTEETRPRRAGERKPSTPTRFTRRAVLLVIGLLTLIIVALVIVLLVQQGSGSNGAKTGAAAQIESAHTALVAQQKTCGAGPDQLSCRREVAGTLSIAHRDFTIDLDRITIPNGASDARDTVEEDATLLSNAYDDLSVASSNASYERIALRDDLAGLTSSFERHYTALVAAVRAG
jgi:hypothetical protein